MTGPLMKNFIDLVRNSDPTRANDFRGCILETPKARSDRLALHKVEALKLYGKENRAFKVMQEQQKKARAARLAEREKRNAERERLHREAKARAACAGAYMTETKVHCVNKKNIELQSDAYLKSKVKTLEGEVQALSSRNQSLQSGIEAMKLELASIKQINTDLSEKRSTNSALDDNGVKSILTRICLDSQYEPTPEEALQCVTALHGDRLFVLPSGWESAKKAEHFHNGRRLLTLLMRLATSYYEAMVEGGDVQARRVFTVSEYAGKESETIMNSRALMKARTWSYQNREIPMVRHLKIGVSTDTSLSIRVYFEYLPDLKRIVIGWCGEHRPVPGITS